VRSTRVAVKPWTRSTGRESAVRNLSGDGDAESPDQRRRLAERESDHVRIASRYRLHERAAGALDGIATGFVAGFAGADVIGDLVVGGGTHLDASDDSRAFNTTGSSVEDREPGDDLVGATAKEMKHALGVCRVSWFAEHQLIEDDNGIGTDDETGTAPFRNRAGLAFRKRRDRRPDCRAEIERFIDFGRYDDEWERQTLEEFPAARRGRG
jgi:hypothetical protein